MRCKIVSQETGEVFDGLKSVSLPACSGEMQVLPGHAEGFMLLKEGKVVIENNERHSISVPGGVCYVKDDEVLVIL